MAGAAADKAAHAVHQQRQIFNRRRPGWQQLLKQVSKLLSIDSRQHRFTLWRRAGRVKALGDQRRGFGQSGIHGDARHPRDALDAAIHQFGNATGFNATATRRSIHKFGPQRPKRRGHRLVHIALHAFSQTRPPSTPWLASWLKP